MKNVRRLVLVTAFFFGVATLQAQVRSADSLVQKLFATLQAKDEKAFVALYPDQQQFSRFIRGILEKVLKSEQMQKMMAADEKSKNLNVDSLINAQVATTTGAEGFGKMQAEFGKSFQKIIEAAEQKGVKWSDAKLTNYTVDSAAAADKDAEAFNLTGLKEAKGVIDFSVGNSSYQLAYGKLMYIESEGGWFGGEFTQVARKGELVEPAAADSVDSVVSSQKELKPTAPAKKKTTTKGKDSNSKSPARKTKS